MSKGKYKRLGPIISNEGIIVVGSRTMKWSPLNYDSDGVPLLPHNHRLSRLYVEKVHNEIHGAYKGISTMIARVRERYWITQLPIMAKSAKSRCFHAEKVLDT